MVRTRLLLLLVPLLAAVGCTVAGPSAISNGRSVYNEVINHTEDEQTLNMIVRHRYDQTFGMLTVASVTANIKIGASAGSDFRVWGRGKEVDGNLVPLSVGVAYEENPTISYIPLSGESFLRQMLTPITVEQGFLLMNAAADRRLWIRELFASINGLHNPVGRAPSPEFERLVELLLKLRRTRVAELGRADTPDENETRTEYFFSVNDYGDEHDDDVREFLELLGIEGIEVDGKGIAIPIRWSSGKSNTAVHFQTRSAFEVIRHVANMIEVPADHIEAGIVEPSGWEGTTDLDRLITIHSSKRRPKDAVVAVPFRDWWYYIDATDTRSKRSFALIRLLIGMRLQDKTSEQKGPVLTVPVG